MWNLVFFNNYSLGMFIKFRLYFNIVAVYLWNFQIGGCAGLLDLTREGGHHSLCHGGGQKNPLWVGEITILSCCMLCYRKIHEILDMKKLSEEELKKKADQVDLRKMPFIECVNAGS